VDKQGIVFNAHYLMYFDVAQRTRMRCVNLKSVLAIVVGVAGCQSKR